MIELIQFSPPSTVDHIAYSRNNHTSSSSAPSTNSSTDYLLQQDTMADQADVYFLEKPLLEKIQDFLERNPETYDVTFCVGKGKKIVRALKVILKAASPVLEKEFKEKWEVAGINERKGIPLPDLNSAAFELFINLTSLDSWSMETLKNLNLRPKRLLSLLSICRRFEMRNAVQILEQLATTFIQSFHKYKDTDEFLRLSQRNLKAVLLSDDIEVNELEVFHCAIRWAEFQCKKRKLKPTDEHTREVLGDCVFEIRFPIMSSTEFEESTKTANILTAEEARGIDKFIRHAADEKVIVVVDAKKFLFKTKPRKKMQELLESQAKSKSKTKTNIDEVDSLPEAVSTLCLTKDFQVVKNPPFVCDGSEKYNFIVCEKNITVYGISFLGPIENDGFYDVKVQIRGHTSAYRSKMFEKRIFAQKGKKLYFFFDAPVKFEAGSVSSWDTYYYIVYYLKGADTFTVERSYGEESVLQEGEAKFRLQWASNQLAEVFFKLG